MKLFLLLRVLTRYSNLYRYALAIVFLIATSVTACQVPVFRYALERWLVDQYEIVILHDGPMKGGVQSRYASFHEKIHQATNAIVRDVDIQQAKEPSYARLWKDKRSDEAAIMAIYYPQSAREIPDRLMYVGSLTDEANEFLFDSPLRQQIAHRLAKGQSAVWIFVPIGNAEKDEAAKTILDQELERCQQMLVLPTLEELELKNAEEREQAGKLRIEFSSLALDRKDAKEQYLLRMLLGSESDLKEIDEPLVFPVFGRGRVLYALVGKGINREMIHTACQFMVGPCSCQVKAQNPGFDLLTSSDWESAIGGVKISDPLPDAEAEPVLLKIPSGRKTK